MEWIIFIGRGIARRLFKSWHNMMKERRLGPLKALGGSKLEEGVGVAEYATERHIFNFMKINVLKLILKSQIYVKAHA